MLEILINLSFIGAAALLGGFIYYGIKNILDG